MHCSKDHGWNGDIEAWVGNAVHVCSYKEVKETDVSFKKSFFVPQNIYKHGQKFIKSLLLLNCHFYRLHKDTEGLQWGANWEWIKELKSSGGWEMNDPANDKQWIVKNDMSTGRGMRTYESLLFGFLCHFLPSLLQLKTVQLANSLKYMRLSLKLPSVHFFFFSFIFRGWFGIKNPPPLQQFKKVKKHQHKIKFFKLRWREENSQNCIGCICFIVSPIIEIHISALKLTNDCFHP